MPAVEMIVALTRHTLQATPSVSDYGSPHRAENYVVTNRFAVRTYDRLQSPRIRAASGMMPERPTSETGNVGTVNCLVIFARTKMAWQKNARARALFVSVSYRAAVRALEVDAYVGKVPIVCATAR